MTAWYRSRRLLRWPALGVALAAGVWMWWTAAGGRPVPARVIRPVTAPVVGPGAVQSRTVSRPGGAQPKGPAAPAAVQGTTVSQARPATAAAADAPAEPIGRPNPFVPLVAPPRPAARPEPSGGLPPVPPLLPGSPGPRSDMSVTGIIWTPPQVAIIVSGGRTYVAGVGDRVGDAVVAAIRRDAVVLKTDQTTFELHVGGDHTP